MINNERELISCINTRILLRKVILQRNLESNSKLDIENLTIDYDFKYPFAERISVHEHFPNPTLRFINCTFTKDIQIHKGENALEFTDNCIFEGEIISKGGKQNIKFTDCSIKNINFENAVFGEEGNKQKGKVRFHNCQIKGETNFRNTTFYNLADFWSSTFHQKVTFYKTDFLGITVFSAATFNENVLFTYSLIEKQLIFRETHFKHGLDLSTAIMAGDLNVFDIQLGFFMAEDVLAIAHKALNNPENLKKPFTQLCEEFYEASISKNGRIPVQNKEETYRILKNQFLEQNNTPEALHFKMLERRTYKDQLDTKHAFHIENNWQERLTLWLNDISNNHGTSWIHAFWFTLISGFLCFALSVFGYQFPLLEINPFRWDFNNWLGYFVQFMLPTHKFDYIKTTLDASGWFYFWDFTGRIMVGYGVYQFIQAFRKYK
jgi:hypothetical protein